MVCSCGSMPFRLCSAFCSPWWRSGTRSPPPLPLPAPIETMSSPSSRALRRCMRACVWCVGFEMLSLCCPDYHDPLLPGAVGGVGLCLGSLQCPPHYSPADPLSLRLHGCELAALPSPLPQCYLPPPPSLLDPCRRRVGCGDH